ncbi:hypothetical protein VZT92_010776 [Zoarces viviparus]
MQGDREEGEGDEKHREKGKGELKTREREGERDLDKNDENVRVLTCFPQQQEGSKARGEGTLSAGRREEEIVGGGE